MGLLGFNQRFTQILAQSKDLNGELMSAIQSTDNQQILVIFSSYGYPFLFGLTPSSSSSSSSSSVSNGKKGSGNAEEIERQKEIMRLKNINQQLEKHNIALQTEVNELKESKKILVINSAKAIDQLRDFLIQYQKP